MPIPNNVTMQDVTSSNLKRIGYDGPTKTLFVEFTDGNAYKYSKVPQEKYNALFSAASVGKFFTAEIRSKYQFEKI